jgi:hypothetical protein
MNDLLNYFIRGSCGSFKNSIKFGLNEFVLIFIFLCTFFIIGKIVAYLIHGFLRIVHKVTTTVKS